MSTSITTARTGRTRRCTTTRPPDVGHTRSGHECPASTARPDRRPDPEYAQAAYGDTAFGTHTLHGACRAMAAARTAPAGLDRCAENLEHEMVAAVERGHARRAHRRGTLRVTTTWRAAV